MIRTSDQVDTAYQVQAHFWSQVSTVVAGCTRVQHEVSLDLHYATDADLFHQGHLNQSQRRPEVSGTPPWTKHRRVSLHHRQG